MAKGNRKGGSLDGEDRAAEGYLHRILGGQENKHPAFMPPDEGVKVTIGNPSLGLPSLAELGYDARKVGDMAKVLGDDGVPTMGLKAGPNLDELPEPPPPLLISEEIEAALERPGADKDPGAWQRGQGWHLMEMRYWSEAKAYYLRVKNKHPELPDGYLGLAAAYLGMGKTKLAVSMIIKGCTGPKSDVVQAGKVVARGLAEEPESWIPIANLCAKNGTEVGLECAREILKATINEARKYTGTTVFDDATKTLARLEKILELRRRDPNAFKAQRRQIPWRALVGMLLLLVCAGLTWFSIQFFRGEDANDQYRKGLVEYAEGNRLASCPGAAKVASGSLDDPALPWARAFKHFQQAVKISPKHTEAQYLLMTTGKRLLGRANGNPEAISVPLDEVSDAVTTAAAAYHKLDPSGEASKNVQADLSHLK